MVVRRNIIDIEAAERDLQEKLFRKVNTMCRSVIIIIIIKLPIEINCSMFLSIHINYS